MQNRPLRPFEQGAHLHVLDWAHDTARYRLQAAGAVQVKAAAKYFAQNLAGPGADASALGPPPLPSLAAAVHLELTNLYAVGHATVRSELDHQAAGQALPIGLSQATTILALGDAPDGRLIARARLIASSVAHDIWQAIHRARLQGITGKRQLRAVGEQAGSNALKQAASHHAGGTINAGRTAAATIHTAQGRTQIVGARYTSVLDKNSCGPCAAADTGELYPLDSPALIHPPNPACLGGDRCRCILVYQLSTEHGSVPVAVAASRDSRS